MSFYHLGRPVSLRELRADLIGQLTSFRGTVTRISEVRPELFMGCFRCAACQTNVPHVVQHFRLTYPVICPNPACGNRRDWVPVLEHSTFVDWQKIRVQETPEEVRECLGLG